MQMQVGVRRLGSHSHACSLPGGFLPWGLNKEQAFSDLLI